MTSVEKWKEFASHREMTETEYNLLRGVYYAGVVAALEVVEDELKKEKLRDFYDIVLSEVSEMARDMLQKPAKN